MRFLLLLLALTGCDDTLFGVPRDGTALPLGDGFCGVRDVFDAHCVSCHGTGGQGGLDLHTDPAGALIGVPSVLDPSVLRVVAGNPEASLLVQKLEATQGGLGGVMPPGIPLEVSLTGLVRQWVADGASTECTEPGDTDPPDGLYPHPDGWAAPDQHGLHAKLQDLICTECHGADLTGDLGPSCDSCHAEGWRTDCVYCHGGTNDLTGAPPRDIDGSTTDLTFAPHSKHVQETALHVAWDCTTCHVKPVDILSPGHLFVGDTTPGVAEVVLTGGLSSRGVYTASTATCSNAYCHGSGQGHDGTIQADATSRTCSSCHPDASSPRSRLADMSGEHRDHIYDWKLSCNDCHADTTSDGRSILDVTLHVDGRAQVALPAGITRSGQTCTGSCHGQIHEGERW